MTSTPTEVGKSRDLFRYFSGKSPEYENIPFTCRANHLRLSSRSRENILLSFSPKSAA
jgi:hypothetical protein